MKFYTTIAALTAVIGTASSAHVAATSVGGKDDVDAPSTKLRRMNVGNLHPNHHDDERALAKIRAGAVGGQPDEKGQVIAPGIEKQRGESPWQGKGPIKEEEGGPVKILLMFDEVPDKLDRAEIANILSEVLSNTLVEVEGKLVVLKDVEVEAEDEKSFTIHFGSDQRSLQTIKGTLDDIFAYCYKQFRLSNQRNSDSTFIDIYPPCILNLVLNALDSYQTVFGGLGLGGYGFRVYT